ncbi:MAG: hypothetical protein ABJJ48_06300, partial [Marinomonas sp.]
FASAPKSAAFARSNFELAAPSGRVIDGTHWTPEGKAAGTKVFSHGANLAPLQYLQMIEPWAASGW